MINSIERIQKFNKGRDKKFIQLKYQVLKESPYRFYRGTAHLFFEDFPKSSKLLNCPKTWLCGDLHLENFGSYKSQNRLVYFDINDFDEAYMGPALLDVTRLMVSIIVFGKQIKYLDKEIVRLCLLFQFEYFEQLQKAHASRIESEISEGVIRKYFDAIKSRKREAFITNRTRLNSKSKPKFSIDNKRYYNVDTETYKKIEVAFKSWRNEYKLNSNFFKIHDIAYRVAGTGSLGLKRYALLVEGKGYPQNYILDIKEAIESTVQKYFPENKMSFKTQSERIVTIQKRMQDNSSAFLSALSFQKMDFIVKEHQPSEDKMDLMKMSKKNKNFENYIISTARLLAWAQLRSSGLYGSANADDLIKYAKKTKNTKEIMVYAFKYSESVLKDYKNYVKTMK